MTGLAAILLASLVTTALLLALLHILLPARQS